MKLNSTLLSIVILLTMFFPLIGMSQVPYKMSYQAVVSDSEANILANKPVGMRISILEGSANGEVVYLEINDSETNSNGLVSIEIGSGFSQDGDISMIDWQSGVYFIKTEIDPTGGDDYTLTSTTQLMSVPFAFHARTVEFDNVGIEEEKDPTVPSFVKSITRQNIDDWQKDNDNTNEMISSFSFENDQLTISEGGVNHSVDLSLYSATPIYYDGDMDSTNEIQMLSINNMNEITLSKGGGTIQIPTITPIYYDADSDSTNELQTLSLVGDQLILSKDGGVVDLPNGGYSLWEEYGNDIVYEYGNVGISTNGSYPLSTLSVGGPGKASTTIYGETYLDGGRAIEGYSSSGYGIVGQSYSSYGGVFVSTEGIGLSTNSPNNIGLKASSIESTAIDAYSVNGNGIQTHGATNGLLAFSDDTGVLAFGDNVGVWAVGSEFGLQAQGDVTGVYGYGEEEYGVSGHGNLAGVYGFSYSIGVIGQSSSGIGVQGVSEYDYGGVFYSYAEASANRTGVHGYSLHYAGVRGEGGEIGVIGEGGEIGVKSSGGTYDFYADGAGTDYASSSSRRWKHNIVNINNPLIKVAAMRGVYFDWNEDHGGHHDIGFIAEEVGEIIPEIVNYEENGIDAISVDYSKVTPLLVEAIKQLIKENEKLKSDNQNLATRIEVIEHYFKELVENK